MVNVRRRQERSAQTRNRILDAASKEFAASGFGGATTRSIAERAQVQHGLVIYHFQTKLGVWQAAVTRVLEGLHQSIRAILDDADHLDDVAKLRVLMRDMVRTMAHVPELNWLMTHEAADESGVLGDLIDQVIGEDIRETTGLIAKAQAAGRFIEGDPLHLHYLYLGASSRIFVLTGDIEKRLGYARGDPAFIERHIDLCEQLFFRDPPAGDGKGH